MHSMETNVSLRIPRTLYQIPRTLHFGVGSLRICIGPYPVFWMRGVVFVESGPFQTSLGLFQKLSWGGWAAGIFLSYGGGGCFVDNASEGWGVGSNLSWGSRHI